MDKLGFNLSGTIKVWANEYDGKTVYSYGVRVKDPDGGKDKYASRRLRFKGGDPGIKSGTKITITEAFETGYLDKEGKAKLGHVVVMAWYAAEDEDNPDGFAELNEDVPF